MIVYAICDDTPIRPTSRSTSSSRCSSTTRTLNLRDRRRNRAQYERKARLVALTQCVRVRSCHADLEIGDHDQPCGLSCSTACIADAPDVAHVRLTASARQEVDGLAHDGVDSKVREMRDRPVGVLRDAMQNGGVQCGRARAGPDGLSNVHCMGEEETVRFIACGSVDAGGNPHCVRKVHGRTLRAPSPRATPRAGYPLAAA